MTNAEAEKPRPSGREHVSRQEALDFLDAERKYYQAEIASLIGILEVSHEYVPMMKKEDIISHLEYIQDRVRRLFEN